MAVAIAIAVASALLATVASSDPPFTAMLDYRRAALADGALYRLVTAHLVHLSTRHAVLDISALLLVAWIFYAEFSARSLALVSIVAIAAIDASLWLLHPEVDRYAGLSGVLHAWFAAGAVCWALADDRHGSVAAKRAWGVALLIGLSVKLLMESRSATFWLGADPMAVVTSAHRWGAAAGALCGTLFVTIRRRLPDAAASGAS